MSAIVFENFDLLDTRQGCLKTGYRVLIADERIKEITKGPLGVPGAKVYDLGGRTLMPGLIDCHVHITARAGVGAYP